MNQYKILVVDDDTAVAHSLKDSLELLDIYSATIANTGVEALEKIKSKDFNAFLVDQRMPDMTGVEFICELIKTIENPPAIRNMRINMIQLAFIQ